MNEEKRISHCCEATYGVPTGTLVFFVMGRRSFLLSSETCCIPLFSAVSSCRNVSTLRRGGRKKTGGAVKKTSSIALALAAVFFLWGTPVSIAQSSIYWNGSTSGGTWNTTNANWNTAISSPWATGSNNRAHFSLNTGSMSASVSGTVFANRVSSQTVTTLSSASSGAINLIGTTPTLQTEAKVTSAARSILRLQVPVSGTDAQIGGVSLEDYVEVASGGSITMSGRLDIANSLANVRLLQTGGTITAANMDVGAWQTGRTGVLSMSDGVFSVSTLLRIGRGVSTGTMTINGAAAVASAPTLYVKSGDATGTARLTLDAGELRVNTLRRDIAGGSATFAFSGGTLRPLNSNLVIGGTAAANDLPVTLTGSTARISSTDSNSAARTVTLASKLTGLGDVWFAGSGTVVLQVANDHTGATRIEGGTLRLDTNGSLTSSSLVQVGNAVSANATLDVTAKTGGYGIAAGQTLMGSGTIRGMVTIDSGATVSPGNSPGTLTVGDFVFGQGGNYNWQLHDASGVAGVGWDVISGTGSLAINSTELNPFNINLWSLSGTGPDVNGEALGFDGSRSWTWTIASFTGGISGFSEQKFRLNTSSTNATGGFANSFSGTFSVVQAGNDLQLVYAVPEPAAVGTAVLGVMICLGWRRWQTSSRGKAT